MSDAPDSDSAVAEPIVTTKTAPRSKTRPETQTSALKMRRAQPSRVSGTAVTVR